MKRSEINLIMKNAVEFFNEQNFHLPQFAFWSIDEWNKRETEIEKIIENKLGWDITDYGSGNFSEIGLIHFTIRNGNPKDVKKGGIPYCEKVMIIEEGQKLPLHHHKNKIEDIINRGGGILEVKLYSISEGDKLGKETLHVYCDGVEKVLESGKTIELLPGESITITPDFFHTFSAKQGNGKVLLGEVSSVNDDYGDNKFLVKVQRFIEIEEDDTPLYLLYNDYEKYIKSKN
ncbi:MAG: D-lyxose/D-mannose family sugar isomerase [Candidatus Lokiarchaeota archaeon]